jgi:glutaredoxin
MAVVIYTTTYCPYCIRAKRLLDSKLVSYREIKVDNDPAQRREMTRLSGRHTVPQICMRSTAPPGWTRCWQPTAPPMRHQATDTTRTDN